jgi:DNA-directed RNA polymerase subunit RPC12/RpoP
MAIKKCSHCKQELPIESFGHNKSKEDGYSCYCLDCIHTVIRRSRQKHLPTEMAKYKAGYTCQECGSTVNIQAHHERRGDNKSLICLCAECHSKRHPSKLHNLIVKPKANRSYWSNKSIFSLSKEFGVTTSTIIRVAKKLSINKGTISPDDELAIKHSVHRITRHAGMGKIHIAFSIELDKEIREYAEAHNLTRNELAIKAVREYIRKQKQYNRYWDNAKPYVIR